MIFRSTKEVMVYENERKTPSVFAIHFTFCVFGYLPFLLNRSSNSPVSPDYAYRYFKFTFLCKSVGHPAIRKEILLWNAGIWNFV